MSANLTRVFSAALRGVDATEVEIEVNEGAGDPKIIIVGLPDAAVKESRDRVCTAVSNSGFGRPQGRCTINLAPADLKKEGPSFDLPIALGMIGLRDAIPIGALQRCSIVGELALNGRIRPVKGVLSLAIEARRSGRSVMVVPEENAREASVVDGLTVYGVPTLSHAVRLLQGDGAGHPCTIDRDAFFESHRTYGIDFSDVKGQAHVKRAIEVAVAGGHNILLIGPPGTGKSMLAKRIPTIMPRMSESEAIETTKIHSIAGLLDPKRAFLATRPFRSPHHTISDAGLLGGGSNPGPGEVSLAHNGILFLDELPEFRRSTLEVMRQPLEDGRVTITRAQGTMTFPACFMLVSAMNPCPCGYFGDRKRECRCTPGQVAKYRQKISGPLLDRIDLHVEVPLVEYRELASGSGGEGSEAIRRRVEEARSLQEERFATGGGAGATPVTARPTPSNSQMTSAEMRRFCRIDEESSGLLEHAMNELDFSARAHDRILKVARTLADLEGTDAIAAAHVLEAIQYRTLDRKLWV